MAGILHEPLLTAKGMGCGDSLTQKCGYEKDLDCAGMPRHGVYACSIFSCPQVFPVATIP
eukprot:scaffold263378_cov52-Prasinocladus_malaysianus.AAC.1